MSPASRQLARPSRRERARLAISLPYSSLERDFCRRRQTRKKALETMSPSRDRISETCGFAGVSSGTVAIIGGPVVFGMFLDRYDTFWLSQAPHVRLPGGKDCFPGVPPQTPRHPRSAPFARRARDAGRPVAEIRRLPRTRPPDRSPRVREAADCDEERSGRKARDDHAAGAVI